ncbi:MAG: LacI family DNA-binding transcriptional regulator [Planctomycetota bacterium]
MPVSIADVAQKAKVSISTVSRVVNGRNIVNVKTRERVEQAIVELGYRPNLFARGLMLNKSNILALLLPDLHGDFYSEVIRGANLRARELGYHLLVSSVDPKEVHAMENLVATARHAMADGVAMLVSDRAITNQNALDQIDFPLVILDGESKGGSHDAVIIDHREGTVALMRHLVGCPEVQRIIFVGGPETNIDSSERFEAYKQVMQEAGLRVSRRDVFHLDFQFESAHALGLDRMRDWIGPRNCVFAGNDEMAAGLVHAALSLGVAIPEDLRVVGFDDARIAQLIKPQLTTVRVPMASMGAAAIELLTKRLEEPHRPRTKITLQAELVVRESCGLSRVR